MVIFWYFLPDKLCSPSFVYAGSHTIYAISHYSSLIFCVFRQYQDFLEDLEEDEALRKNVNIFRGKQEDIYTALTDFRPSEQFFLFMFMSSSALNSYA